ncbi:MAG: hypothetical protein HY042_03485 [Spirochaetia bacterium]|nr:hypothetical protein [Spirochaetia bacterium]
MPKPRSIRIWTNLDVDEVRKHLLYIDDLYGTCGSCKQLGLNYLKDKTCPKCGATFTYLATTLKKPADTAKILARLTAEGLPFKLIDREDFERAGAHDAVGELFGKE